MWDKIKENTLPTIIALAALSVSASAAFYSVSGLSKLFAGAALEVTIMAASLEVAKLVIASLLYRYWSTINKYLRTYLSIAAVVLVLITSMGIYGFLSAAYQDTYRQLTIKDNQTAFLTQKKDFYEKDVIRYDSELERISSNISTLSNAKSTAIQVKDTSVVGGVRTTVSTAELRLAQQRIGVEEENRKEVQVKREVAADSLQKYQLEILDLENNSEVAGELGPLQYLSGLTGAPMDKIINILLLVIIFVFDPLAISLVIAANFAFDQAKPKKKYKENLYGEMVEDKFSEWDNLDEEDTVTEEEIIEELNEHDTILKGLEVRDAEEIKTKEEFLSQLDQIENHSDWEIESEEHEEEEEYHELDLDKDGVIDENEIQLAKDKIKELENRISTQSLSGWRVLKIKAEIDKIKSLLLKEDDDITKTY